MKSIPVEYKNLLLTIAAKVQVEVAKRIDDDRVVKIDKLKAWTTDTFGYYVEIFSFRRITGRGKIELWLDLWTNLNRPILCVCFWSSDLSRIYQIIETSFPDYNDDHPTKLKYFSNGNVLAYPLAKKYFEKFLVEPYYTKYLTYYFTEKIGMRNATTKTFLTKVVKKTEFLIHSIISALEIPAHDDSDFSALENRQIVKQHIQRERSRMLAEKVKKRDDYTCRVCGFNAFDFYGKHGIKVAEAHHVISLSKLKNKTKTTPADMITVCANCHRVLHRMEGNADDYKVLRRIIRKKRPE
jgi:5-methylcytosine-specific restriction endonuclease McrA